MHPIKLLRVDTSECDVTARVFALIVINSINLFYFEFLRNLTSYLSARIEQHNSRRTSSAVWRRA